MNELYEVMTEAEKSEFRTQCIMEFGYTERTFYNKVGGAKNMKRFEVLKMTEIWLSIVKPQK